MHRGPADPARRPTDAYSIQETDCGHRFGRILGVLRIPKKPGKTKVPQLRNVQISFRERTLRPARGNCVNTM